MPGDGLCRAEVFLLRSGGRIEGTWLNRQQGVPQQYEIAMPGGGRVTLDAAQVRRTIRQDAEKRYQQIVSRCPDTVEGHWKLAEWCRKNGLKKQRRYHLQRIIQLEPDHVDARHALGYSQVRGQWVTREEILRRRGYNLHEGRWLLAQEIALQQRQRENEQAEKSWLVRLRR